MFHRAHLHTYIAEQHTHTHTHVYIEEQSAHMFHRAHDALPHLVLPKLEACLEGSADGFAITLELKLGLRLA